MVEDGTTVISRLSEDVNRKVIMFQGKYGIIKKNEAVARILEKYFEGKEEYELKKEAEK